MQFYRGDFDGAILVGVLEVPGCDDPLFPCTPVKYHLVFASAMSCAIGIFRGGGGSWGIFLRDSWIFFARWAIFGLACFFGG